MFAGSLVALVTPMQPDGSIDFDAWSRLLEFHVANGTSGIVVAGSTGESATVTDSELRELLLHARRTLGKRAALIANAGTSSTATSVERARWILRSGLIGADRATSSGSGAQRMSADDSESITVRTSRAEHAPKGPDT